MGTTTFVTLAASRWIKVTDPDGSSHFSNFFFGEPRSTALGPQAFRAHLGAGRETRAHFHHVQQFQLFFGTPGAYFQRQEMGPLLLHYSDADTLYGPFGSGKEPIILMTLRANGSGYRGVMPDNKDELAPSLVRRHHEISLADWIAQPLLRGDGVEVTPLISPADDGLAITALEAGANAVVAPPTPEGFGGQYYVVVQGSLRHHGTELPELTVGWGDPDAEAPALTAGDQGVRLLALRFGHAPKVDAMASGRSAVVATA